MRTALSVALVAVVVLSTVAAVPTAVGAATTTGDAQPHRSPSEAAGPASAANASASSHDACEPVSAGDAPDDPASDRLGWENGCWYDEPLDVTRSDGLNDTELDAVVARAMARVERIRELEFNETVPVEIVSREAFRENTTTGATTSTNNSLHQNVKWEAMLMTGEDTDAVSVQQSTTASSVLGYYSPDQERIVIVSEDTESPEMNEVTLSQELFHALQDQRFDISGFEQSTRELHNARDGIIEGDGNLVDRLYQQRCTAEWDCLLPQSEGGDSGGQTGDIHYGMYFVTFQPYSDGPKFVEQIYDAAGWDGVNAVYEDPPASTEQVIHPEKYGEDPPTEVTFTDRSSEEWTVPHLENGAVDYAQFGEAGLATMLFYPTYESGGQAQPVVGIRSFFNYTATGQLSQYDPFNYTTRYTDGWDGDRLYPYVTDDSAETNETGYVWKTVWDAETDAAEFVAGYATLLEYRGAEPVDGREMTYRIPDGEYADAFYVDHTGSTVTLVNAPSVEELNDVREGAAPETGDGDGTPGDATPTDGGADEPTATPTDAPGDDPTATNESDDGGVETPDPGETTTTSDGGPGFGVVAALVGLVLTVLAVRRRH